MYRLITFGGLTLAKDGEPFAPPTIQRRQLALLALLAVAGRSGISRDKLVAYLWPEREADKARNLLDQALRAARRTFGQDVFASLPTALALNRDILGTDVTEFDEAIAASAWERAVELYTGPFLDGVFINDAPEFERWSEGERSRRAHSQARALESLAAAADAASDPGRAIGWWRRLVQAEPLSARYAIGLMRALAAAGDRSGALEFARVYEALVRQELSVPPDRAVTELAETLRSAPPGGVRPPIAPPPASRPAAAAVATVPEPATASPVPALSSRANGSGAGQIRRDTPAAVMAALPPSTRVPIRRLAFAGAVVVIVASAGVALARRSEQQFADSALRADSGAPGQLTDDAAVASRSIAVLPFVNLGDAQTNYFSDGFSDEVITGISQLPGLRVAARTSSFAFRDKQTDAIEIGRRLNVGLVLEGSVQRDANRLRVISKLINARTGMVMTSFTYDGAVSDVFTAQDSITRQLVSRLRTALDSAPSRVSTRRHHDFDAYQLYLQGRYAWRQRTGESLLRAARFFDLALAKDPRYAEAYAGRADVYAVLPLYLAVTTNEMYRKAEEDARRAIELDSALAEPYATLGFMHARRYQWPDAEREFRHAIARDPNYATAHQWFGKMLGTSGKLREAEAELLRALELDPLSPVIHYNLGQNLLWQRRYDDAVAVLEKVLTLDATFYPARTVLGYVRIAQGRPADAVAELRRVLDTDRTTDDRAVLAFAQAVAGQRDSATAALAGILREAQRSPVSAADIALVYIGLGDHDRAFTWLDKALATHDSDLEAFIQSPTLDPLRNDRRFAALRRAMNLP
jgi:TolB-like protein/DNA-binding SARP family transcriptional activator/Tfp pilus assembly protein PilF